MLSVFRLHTKGCSAGRPRLDRGFKKCKCPIHVEGKCGDAFIRKSLGTTSWQRAQQRVLEAEARGSWEPLPEELKGARMSCAEIAAANRQALVVNKQVAAHAAAMLSQFLAGELRYFALYFDQASGTARSRYITPESVMACL